MLVYKIESRIGTGGLPLPLKMAAGLNKNREYPAIYKHLQKHCIDAGLQKSVYIISIISHCVFGADAGLRVYVAMR